MIIIYPECKSWHSILLDSHLDVPFSIDRESFLHCDTLSWSCRSNSHVPSCVGDICSCFSPVHVSILRSTVRIESDHSLTIWSRGQISKYWSNQWLHCTATSLAIIGILSRWKSCNYTIDGTAIVDDIFEILTKHSISSTCWYREWDEWSREHCSIECITELRRE